MELFNFVNDYFNLKNFGCRLMIALAAIAIIGLDAYCSINIYRSDPGTLRNSIAMCACHLSMGLIIYMWIFAAPRVVKWHKELEQHLYEITGVVIDKEVSRGEGKNKIIEEGRDLWNKQEKLICILPWKGYSIEASAVKVIYIILWIVIVMAASSCVLPIKLEYLVFKNASIGTQSVLTIIIAEICMILCSCSWWCTIEFCYFLSRVSRLKSIQAKYGTVYLEDGSCVDSAHDGIQEIGIIPRYYFNSIHPSQTHAIKQMLHASTMLSIAFCIASGLLVAQYVSVVRIIDNQDFLNPISFAWLMVNMIPGLFSMLVVVTSPKLFIARIHRKWKLQLIKDFEDRQNSAADDGEYRCYNELIDAVANDKLDFHHIEITLAMVYTILEIVVLILSYMHK